MWIKPSEQWMKRIWSNKMEREAKMKSVGQISTYLLKARKVRGIS